MQWKEFRAYRVSEKEPGIFRGEIVTLNENDLPAGDVLIKVYYSSLNYKDALSASGNRGVTKNYPHVPGIDAAGVVMQSSSESFRQGDQVLVTGYDLGMNTSGGFGEYIRVPAGWVVKIPEGLTMKESMQLGTAGFTAAMAVYQIHRNVSPEQGEVVVTGASGGVGSLAILLLSRLGYKIAAVTGKPHAAQLLHTIGAHTILRREEILEGSEKPLLKPRWSAAVDTVGGDILANVIKATGFRGWVVACGNARSADLPINVYPFILRGVTLTGADSQNCPMDHRLEIWNLLAGKWKPEFPESLFEEVTPEQLSEKLSLLLKGEIIGRVILRHIH